jgi:hypothetical protein
MPGWEIGVLAALGVALLFWLASMIMLLWTYKRGPRS